MTPPRGAPLGRAGELGSERDDGLCRDASRAQAREGFGAAPRREPLAVGPDDDRAVGEDRLDRAQGAQQEQVAGRVREMILAAHDVRDAEIAVVDGGREVERRPPVRAHEHEVADLARFEAHGAARRVLDDDPVGGHAEADAFASPASCLRSASPRGSARQCPP